MKIQAMQSTKQKGFTLLESLVGLVIFSIIIFGSGLAISRMLNVQKDINTNYVIINEMQNRLQSAIQSTEGTPVPVCESTTLKQNISFNGKVYIVKCGVIKVGSSEVEWPVLAASTDATKATACAAGTASDDCYIVGR